MDYYHTHAEAYFTATVGVDPTPWLSPLAGRLCPGDRVLDVGCGSGRDLLWMKRRGYDPIGLERSLPLAVMARDHSGCPVIVGDLRRFPFSRMALDALMLIGALVHIPHEHFSTIFQEVASGVKPGGHILISLKEGVGRTRDDRGREFYFWEDASLRGVFSEAGWTVHRFTRPPSALKTRENWLEYLLKRETPP